MGEKFEDIYERRELNNSVFDWIAKQLKYSAVLSEKFIQKFSNSKAWTLAPKGISEKELYEFDYGGKVVHDDRPQLSETIYKKMLSIENSVWIIEDNTSHVEYSKESNKIDNFTEVFYFNKCVFHLLIEKDDIPKGIYQTLRVGGAYPFIGFITKINEDISANIFSNTVNNSDMEVIRENISLFVIGVYDEETYIMVEI